MKNIIEATSLISSNGWTIRKMVGMALLFFAAIFLATIVYIFSVIDGAHRKGEKVSETSLHTAELMNQLGSQITTLKQQDLALVLEAQNLAIASKVISNAVFLYVNQFTEDPDSMDQSYAKLADSLGRLEQLWPSELPKDTKDLIMADAQIIEDIISELKDTSSPSQLEEMHEDVNNFALSLEERSTQIKNIFSERIEKATGSIQANSQKTLDEAVVNAKSTKQTAEMMEMLNSLIGIMSVGILVALILFWLFINRVISNPVSKIITCIEKLSRGDLTARIELTGKTELVKLADSLNSMGTNLQSLVSTLSSIGWDLAESSKLVSESSERSSHDMSSLNAETENIATAIQALTEASISVAENSIVASSNAEKASHQAVKSSSVVNSVTASIENLAENVGNATKVISLLASEVNNIGSVTEVIHGISEQTNLLALNAAIEAARAGEQGRGFAVVADEVRALASKTNESTDEIQKMIISLQNGAQNAVKAMELGKLQASESVSKGSEAVSELKQTTEAISEITEISRQIATSSAEQKQVINTLNDNVHRISHLTDNTADGALNIATETKNLDQLAIDQQQAISLFKLN